MATAEATKKKQAASTEAGDGFEPEASNGRPAMSVIEQLRAKRQQILEQRVKLFEVNGYSGKLWASYRLLDFPEVEKISKKTHKSGNPNKILLGSVDTLIAACEQLWWKENDEAEAVPLSTQISTNEQEPPVRYDKRLAEALGIDKDSARGVVLGVFENDLAVLTHAERVADWMKGERKDVEDDFSGE